MQKLGVPNAASNRSDDAKRRCVLLTPPAKATKLVTEAPKRMAGNEPGFEEATRALFANNRERFAEMTERWPRDVRDHARMLAERC